MAVNERTFIRIMPESTGDRVHFLHTMDVEYINKTGSFAVGDIVVGSSTGTQAVVIKDTVDNDLATSGVLSVTLIPGFESKSFTNADTLNVFATPQASAVTSYGIYVGATTLVSGDNSHFHQRIDNEGQAFTRFAEGAPSFDAFGKMRISEQTVIGEYLSKYSIDAKLWRDVITGNSTIAHVSSSGGVVLANDGSIAASITRSTHLYHQYQLGVSHLIEMTVAVGDMGKAGVNREWGYGDDSDALTFQLSGTTLQVSRNSSTVVNSVVTQANWNGDRLDGTGLSGIVLDVTRNNIYWIDIQWLGAGQVRFGVINNGKRIVCHTMQHSNSFSEPYIRTATLPCRIKQDDTAGSGSTNEIRLWCMTVKTEGEFSPATHEHSSIVQPNERQDGGPYKKLVYNKVPGRAVCTIRPAVTINSIVNRSVGLPESLSWTNEGNYPVYIQARRNATLTGATWQALHTDSSLEMSVDGALDLAGTGSLVGTWCIPANSCDVIDLSKTFNYIQEKVILDGDGSTQETFQYTFSMYTMSPIRGGVDAGTYTATFAAAGNTITKSAGPDFDVEGFVVGDGVHVEDSISNDGYYVITNVAATVLTVEEINGDVTSFTSEAGTSGLTLQGGPTVLSHGSINVEEII